MGMAAETSANAKAYKTAVIKIGSNTLTDDEGKCDRGLHLADLAHQVARVRREGWACDYRKLWRHPVRP